MSGDPNTPTFIPAEPFPPEAVNRARDLLDATPETVGPYRILERLGGGGMGEVYRAEQRTPIRREVALKFIKLGMDTKSVIARFEAERQALALMDHPHIAKVFDAGADHAGRPYFVMEYVKGQPITDYADLNRLTIPERLGLFEQLCQAVQHAHHKGIIHRDLKPSNVLVSTQDGRPFAKVIDFGIAKAVAQPLTEKTLFTEHAQFVGTPQYMSPEQAVGSLDIDTRTDVYSLGVLLYELLTGSTPFSIHDLKAAAFEQVKKLIIEVDPPKPSTHLTLNQATLPSLAANRRIEPKRLGMLIRGELDWIVMKALEKDRKRRYETPTNLALDISAHMRGEAVLAAPPSTIYRIQKFVAKHRGLVLAVTAIFVTFALGTVGTTFGLWRATAVQQDLRETIDFAKSRLSEVMEKTQADVLKNPTGGKISFLARDSKKLGFELKVVITPAGKKLEFFPADGVSETDFTRGMLSWMSNSSVESFNAMIRSKNLESQRADEAERALARGLLRPLVGEDALKLNEIDALCELASLDGKAIGLKFVDEASRTEQTMKQFLECAEPALVAAVGLDPRLREMARAKLESRLNDTRLTVSHRSGIALAALMLMPNPEFLESSYMAILNDVRPYQTGDPNLLLYYVAAHPHRFCDLIKPSIVQIVLKKTLAHIKSHRESLAIAVLGTSLRSEPTVAKAFQDTVAQLLVAEYSAPDWSWAGVDDYAESISKSSRQLGNETATAINLPTTKVLLAELKQAGMSCYEIRALGIAIAEFARGLERETASRICGEAAKLVLYAMTNPNLSSHTSSSRAEMESVVAEALVELSKSLESGEANRVCAVAAERLLSALADPEGDHKDSDRLVNALTGLSIHLPEQDLGRTTDALSKLLSRDDPDISHSRIADSLVQLIPKLSDEARSRVAERLLELLRQPDHSIYGHDELFLVLAGKLGNSSAIRFANGLLGVANEPKWDSSDIALFAQSIIASIKNLEPLTANRIGRQLSDVLLADILAGSDNLEQVQAIANLAAVIDQSAAEALCRTVANELILRLDKRESSFEDIAKSIHALSPHLDGAMVSRTRKAIAERALAVVLAPDDDLGEAERIADVLELWSIQLNQTDLSKVVIRLIAHSSFREADVERQVSAIANWTRRFPAEARQRIYTDLFQLLLTYPFQGFMDGHDIQSSGIDQILDELSQKEPHFQLMAVAPSRKARIKVDFLTRELYGLFKDMKLSTPEVVEQIKSPLIQSRHRRAFLNFLECRYGHRFVNHWAFVEYAESEKLGLDFTTRSKRRDAAAILHDIQQFLEGEAAKR